MTPIYFDGFMAEIVQALQSAGYHIHSDKRGNTVASRIPPFLRRGETNGNVVKLRRKA